MPFTAQQHAQPLQIFLDGMNQEGNYMQNLALRPAERMVELAVLLQLSGMLRDRLSEVDKGSVDNN